MSERKTLSNLASRYKLRRRHSWLNCMLAGAVLFAAPHTTSAQLLDRKELSLQAGLQIVAAAQAEAQRLKAPSVIVVVDGGGHTLLAERMDGAAVAGVDLATGKARASAIFEQSTANLQKDVGNAGASPAFLPGVFLFAGGVPILADGILVGAVGVSGRFTYNDVKIAEAAARAFKP